MVNVLQYLYSDRPHKDNMQAVYNANPFATTLFISTAAQLILKLLCL